MSTTPTISHDDLRQVRKALLNVIGTHRGTSKAALASVSDAHKAFQLAFTADEKQRVVDYARETQSRVLEIEPWITTFEQALKEFGTVMLPNVLGAEL